VAAAEHVERNAVLSVATDDLYRRHRSRVLGYCQRYLRRSADAEDALQQTFLQVHRALGRGVKPVSETTWLLAIARNVCLTRIDVLNRRARLEFPEDPSVLASAAAAEAPAEVTPLLSDAINRLPERQRVALFLREWQQLSYGEIAAELGTSEAAVETLLFRARKSLAAQLGAPRRRRRALDLAGLLGWVRSLSGAAVPKVAAGVTAVVAVGAAGVVARDATHAQPVTSHAPAQSAAQRARPAVVARTARSQPSIVRHVHYHQRAASPLQARTTRSAPSTTGQSGPAATAAPGPLAAPGSVPATPAATRPEPPASRSMPPAVAPRPSAPSVPAPVADASGAAVPSSAKALVQGATTTAASTVDAAVDAVNAAVDTVDAGVQTTVAATPLEPVAAPVDAVAQTVTNATSTVSGTVSSTVSHLLGP
jgi:RNA polymerase sigma-70 factor, ECF subfamily